MLPSVPEETKIIIEDEEILIDADKFAALKSINPNAVFFSLLENKACLGLDNLFYNFYLFKFSEIAIIYFNLTKDKK